ncbi:RHS repeat domain-containing protein [Chryseobacterium kimseyorum]|uniref:RHS repeat domain-containing protein n=1 Tax=Chryseobacterium kimseyorum TaxID=2984028 RepID=UPI0038736736
MLQKVKRPDGKEVSFEYDALGRRIAKIGNKKITRYIWDGNVLLHEWNYDIEEEPKTFVDDEGNVIVEKEKVENVVTWVYERGSFVACTKIVNGESYTIISDYIGRPVQSFDKNGEIIWSTDYDIFGQLKNLKGNRNFLPFRQLGQYEDVELDSLYYNRFRYYDNESGNYISQDPMGLFSNEPNFYAFVHDSNVWVDILGLQSGGGYGPTRKANRGLGGEVNHMPANAASQAGGSGISHYKGPATMMDNADHFQTASWGNRTTANQWRSVQEDLISRGKFGKAMEMDIRDVKRKFGNKYDVGMHEMIDYAKNKGYITNAEGQRLKRQHLYR